MTRAKINKWLFKKHPIGFIKLLVVFFVFMLFMSGLEYVLHHTPTELFRIKELTVDDIDFTDIHYQTRNAPAGKNKNIVLINIGSSPQDSIRFTLINLMKTLNRYKPKTIGLDFYFVPNEMIPTNINQELDTLFDTSNVVIGTEYASLSEFPFDSTSKINFGYLNFPGAEKETIRDYYYRHQVKYLGKKIPTVLSFACKLDSICAGKPNYSFDDSSFMIRYYGSDKGYYNAINTEAPADTLHDFPAIETSYILDSGANQNNLKLHNLINGKVVIIGWLGNPVMINKFDLTDKHRVPVNFDLFNRLPTMPGVVVHANALQTLLCRDIVFKIEGWRHNIIVCVIVFLYLLMFMVLHKIRPILLKLIVEIFLLVISTILLIWLSVILMNNGFHLQIGKILLYVAVLIEYKMFAFEFYDYLEEKFSNWRNKTVIKEIKIKNPVNDEE